MAESLPCESIRIERRLIRFPRELINEVKMGLKRRGFHILGRDELKELCSCVSDGAERLQRVQQFAARCGAECEIGLDFVAARFLPKRNGNNDLDALGRMRIAKYNMRGVR